MSVRYNDDFKREVVRAYMTGNKSTVELSAEYNVAKSTISEWAKKYGEEAGTKLLLPMIIMLIVVMAIIMVPALMSFSGY